MFDPSAFNSAGTKSDYQELMNQAADRIEGVRAIRSQLSAVRGEGQSTDGLVRVKVFPGGTFESLDIDPKAMKLPSADVAQAITEAAQAAFDDAADRTQRLLEAALPGSGASLAAMTDPAEVAKGKFAPMDEISSMLEGMRRTT